MKPNKRSEPVSYAEVGAFLHRNNGSAKIKTYTSVNEPLRVEAAEATSQIGRVRVEMHVYEDKSVKPTGEIYEKGINLRQIFNGGDGQATQQIGEENFASPRADSEPSDGLSPLKVLKNFVDNIASGQRLMWAIIVGLAIIAAGALVLAIVR